MGPHRDSALSKHPPSAERAALASIEYLISFKVWFWPLRSGTDISWEHIPSGVPQKSVTLYGAKSAGGPWPEGCLAVLDHSLGVFYLGSNVMEVYDIWALWDLLHFLRACKTEMVWQVFGWGHWLFWHGTPIHSLLCPSGSNATKICMPSLFNLYLNGFYEF